MWIVSFSFSKEHFEMERRIFFIHFHFLLLVSIVINYACICDCHIQYYNYIQNRYFTVFQNYLSSHEIIGHGREKEMDVISQLRNESRQKLSCL